MQVILAHLEKVVAALEIIGRRKKYKSGLIPLC